MDRLVRFLLRIVIIVGLAFGVFAVYWWVVQPIMRNALLKGIAP